MSYLIISFQEIILGYLSFRNSFSGNFFVYSKDIVKEWRLEIFCFEKFASRDFPSVVKTSFCDIYISTINVSPNHRWEMFRLYVTSCKNPFGIFNFENFFVTAFCHWEKIFFGSMRGSGKILKKHYFETIRYPKTISWKDNMFNLYDLNHAMLINR